MSIQGRQLAGINNQAKAKQRNTTKPLASGEIIGDDSEPINMGDISIDDNLYRNMSIDSISGSEGAVKMNRIPVDDLDFDFLSSSDNENGETKINFVNSMGDPLHMSTDQRGSLYQYPNSSNSAWAGAGVGSDTRILPKTLFPTIFKGQKESKCKRRCLVVFCILVFLVSLLMLVFYCGIVVTGDISILTIPNSFVVSNAGGTKYSTKFINEDGFTRLIFGAQLVEEFNSIQEQETNITDKRTLLSFAVPAGANPKLPILSMTNTENFTSDDSSLSVPFISVFESSKNYEQNGTPKQSGDMFMTGVSQQGLGPIDTLSTTVDPKYSVSTTSDGSAFVIKNLSAPNITISLGTAEIYNMPRESLNDLFPNSGDFEDKLILRIPLAKLDNADSRTSESMFNQVNIGQLMPNTENTRLHARNNTLLIQFEELSGQTFSGGIKFVGGKYEIGLSGKTASVKAGNGKTIFSFTFDKEATSDLNGKALLVGPSNLSSPTSSKSIINCYTLTELSENTADNLISSYFADKLSITGSLNGAYKMYSIGATDVNTVEWFGATPTCSNKLNIKSSGETGETPSQTRRSVILKDNSLDGGSFVHLFLSSESTLEIGPSMKAVVTERYLPNIGYKKYSELSCSKVDLSGAVSTQLPFVIDYEKGVNFPNGIVFSEVLLSGDGLASKAQPKHNLKFVSLTGETDPLVTFPKKVFVIGRLETPSLIVTEDCSLDGKGDAALVLSSAFDTSFVNTQLSTDDFMGDGVPVKGILSFANDYSSINNGNDERHPDLWTQMFSLGTIPPNSSQIVSKNLAHIGVVGPSIVNKVEGIQYNQFLLTADQFASIKAKMANSHVTKRFFGSVFSYPEACSADVTKCELLPNIITSDAALTLKDSKIMIHNSIFTGDSVNIKGILYFSVSQLQSTPATFNNIISVPSTSPFVLSSTKQIRMTNKQLLNNQVKIHTQTNSNTGRQTVSYTNTSQSRDNKISIVHNGGNKTVTGQVSGLNMTLDKLKFTGHSLACLSVDEIISIKKVQGLSAAEEENMWVSLNSHVLSGNNVTIGSFNVVPSTNKISSSTNTLTLIGRNASAEIQGTKLLTLCDKTLTKDGNKFQSLIQLSSPSETKGEDEILINNSFQPTAIVYKGQSGSATQISLGILNMAAWSNTVSDIISEGTATDGVVNRLTIQSVGSTARHYYFAASNKVQLGQLVFSSEGVMNIGITPKGQTLLGGIGQQYGPNHIIFTTDIINRKDAVLPTKIALNEALSIYNKVVDGAIVSVLSLNRDIVISNNDASGDKTVSIRDLVTGDLYCFFDRFGDTKSFSITISDFDSINSGNKLIYSDDGLTVNNLDGSKTKATFSTMTFDSDIRIQGGLTFSNSFVIKENCASCKDGVACKPTISATKQLIYVGGGIDISATEMSGSVQVANLSVSSCAITTPQLGLTPLDCLGLTLTSLIQFDSRDLGTIPPGSDQNVRGSIRGKTISANSLTTENKRMIAFERTQIQGLGFQSATVFSLDKKVTIEFGAPSLTLGPLVRSFTVDTLRLNNQIHFKHRKEQATPDPTLFAVMNNDKLEVNGVPLTLKTQITIEDIVVSRDATQVTYPTIYLSTLKSSDILADKGNAKNIGVEISGNSFTTGTGATFHIGNISTTRAQIDNTDTIVFLDAAGVSAYPPQHVYRDIFGAIGDFTSFGGDGLAAINLNSLEESLTLDELTFKIMNLAGSKDIHVNENVSMAITSPTDVSGSLTLKIGDEGIEAQRIHFSKENTSVEKVFLVFNSPISMDSGWVIEYDKCEEANIVIKSNEISKCGVGDILCGPPNRGSLFTDSLTIRSSAGTTPPPTGFSNIYGVSFPSVKTSGAALFKEYSASDTANSRGLEFNIVQEEGLYLEITPLTLSASTNATRTSITMNSGIAFRVTELHIGDSKFFTRTGDADTLDTIQISKLEVSSLSVQTKQQGVVRMMTGTKVKGLDNINIQQVIGEGFRIADTEIVDTLGDTLQVLVGHSSLKCTGDILAFSGLTLKGHTIQRSAMFTSSLIIGDEVQSLVVDEKNVICKNPDNPDCEIRFSSEVNDVFKFHTHIFTDTTDIQLNDNLLDLLKLKIFGSKLRISSLESPISIAQEDSTIQVLATPDRSLAFESHLLFVSPLVFSGKTSNVIVSESGIHLAGASIIQGPLIAVNGLSFVFSSNESGGNTDSLKISGHSASLTDGADNAKDPIVFVFSGTESVHSISPVIADVTALNEFGIQDADGGLPKAFHIKSGVIGGKLVGFRGKSKFNRLYVGDVTAGKVVLGTTNVSENGKIIISGEGICRDPDQTKSITVDSESVAGIKVVSQGEDGGSVTFSPSSVGTSIELTGSGGVSEILLSGSTVFGSIVNVNSVETLYMKMSKDGISSSTMSSTKRDVVANLLSFSALPEEEDFTYNTIGELSFGPSDTDSFGVFIDGNVQFNTERIVFKNPITESPEFHVERMLFYGKTEVAINKVEEASFGVNVNGSVDAAGVSTVVDTLNTEIFVLHTAGGESDTSVMSKATEESGKTLLSMLPISKDQNFRFGSSFSYQNGSFAFESLSVNRSEEKKMTTMTAKGVIMFTPSESLKPLVLRGAPTSPIVIDPHFLQLGNPMGSHAVTLDMKDTTETNVGTWNTVGVAPLALGDKFISDISFVSLGDELPGESLAISNKCFISNKGFNGTCEYGKLLGHVKVTNTDTAEVTMGTRAGEGLTLDPSANLDGKLRLRTLGGIDDDPGTMSVTTDLDTDTLSVGFGELPNVKVGDLIFECLQEGCKISKTDGNKFGVTTQYLNSQNINQTTGNGNQSFSLFRETEKEDTLVVFGDYFGESATALHLFSDDTAIVFGKANLELGEALDFGSDGMSFNKGNTAATYKMNASGKFTLSNTDVARPVGSSEVYEAKILVDNNKGDFKLDSVNSPLFFEGEQIHFAGSSNTVMQITTSGEENSIGVTSDSDVCVNDLCLSVSGNTLSLVKTPSGGALTVIGSLELHGMLTGTSLKIKKLEPTIFHVVQESEMRMEMKVTANGGDHKIGVANVVINIKNIELNELVISGISFIQSWKNPGGSGIMVGTSASTGGTPNKTHHIGKLSLVEPSDVSGMKFIASGEEEQDAVSFVEEINSKFRFANMKTESERVVIQGYKSTAADMTVSSMQLSESLNVRGGSSTLSIFGLKQNVDLYVDQFFYNDKKYHSAHKVPLTLRASDKFLFEFVKNDTTIGAYLDLTGANENSFGKVTINSVEVRGFNLDSSLNCGFKVDNVDLIQCKGKDITYHIPCLRAKDAVFRGDSTSCPVLTSEGKSTRGEAADIYVLNKTLFEKDVTNCSNTKYDKLESCYMKTTQSILLVGDDGGNKEGVTSFSISEGTHVQRVSGTMNGLNTMEVDDVGALTSVSIGDFEVKYKIKQFKGQLIVDPNKTYYLYMNPETKNTVSYARDGSCDLDGGDGLKCSAGNETIIVSGEQKGYYLELEEDIESWFN